jgi:peptidoglycan/LPS O-acetylase OafA/YrhL
MASESSARPGYRPEIQGLRAVAALLVAVYHIWFGRVSGGVDVLFVVSAFLVTTSLLRRAESQGRVDFLGFWGGMSARLLPAASLVLAVTAVATILLLPRPIWEDTIGQILASLLQVQNWHLAFSAADYLAQDQSAGPVRHFWAMSIQWQFYLIWPVVFLVAIKLSNGMHVPLRRVLLLLLGAIFLPSFLYSIIATRSDQAFAYFNTFARLWEFCIGAVLALFPVLIARRGLRLAAGWVGLAGILVCGMIFQVSRVFPGYAALWPVCCAALIIVAATSGSRFGADRVLATPWLMRLGDSSYGLYLWHWPLLVFYRWFSGQQIPGLMAGLGILGTALILAQLTTRWVDQPLRGLRFDQASPRRLARFATLALAPALLVTTAWAGYVSIQQRHDERVVPVDHAHYPGARAREAGFTGGVPAGVPVYPGMLAVSEDWPSIYDDGCYRPDADWQRQRCIYGDPKGSTTIALVGGSHAAHWMPALDLAAREKGWRVVIYTKNLCLFTEPVPGEPEQDRWCREWNDATVRILLEDLPDLVITTSTRGSGEQERVPEGYLRRWEKLHAAGIQVVALRDTPWMKFWVPECLDLKGNDPAKCSQPRSVVLAASDPADAVRSRVPYVHFVDMSEYFCDASRCPPVIGNVIVYRDDSHITAAYSRTLAPMLKARLEALPAVSSELVSTSDRRP